MVCLGEGDVLRLQGLKKKEASHRNEKIITIDLCNDNKLELDSAND